MNRIAIASLVAATLATGAFAKGHNQADTAVPGQDAGATSAAAQTLGSAKGNRPADKTPMSPGKSASAGR